MRSGLTTKFINHRKTSPDEGSNWFTREDDFEGNLNSLGLARHHHSCRDWSRLGPQCASQERLEEAEQD
jgi:hypothetical protein